MRYVFKKLVIHNFLSFSDAEISLENRGYCAIKGINNNPKDNTKSNGSGKSTIINALCWALTGETLTGLTTNVANIYIDEGCYVNLLFNADGKEYNITRYRDDPKRKNDLTIIVDSEDKSGKGLKESQIILEQLLPEITPELLKSTILFGQGLPGKFSANKASDKKKILERLFKTDEMYAALETKVKNRESELAIKNRTYEDIITKENGSIIANNNNLTYQNNLLAELLKPVNYDTQITSNETILNDVNNKLVKANEEFNKANTSLTEAITKISESKAIQSKEYYEQQTKNNEGKNNLLLTESKLNSRKRDLTNEILRLKSIKDVCPTCGQKLQGVVKPSTEAQEKELNEIENQLKTNKEVLDGYNKKANQLLEAINSKYDNTNKDLNNNKLLLENQLNIVKGTVNTLNTQKYNTEAILNKLKLEKANHENKINQTKDSIKQITETIAQSNKVIADTTEAKNKLQEHIDVVTKIETLMKRDFRGYLLKSVIAFIDKKAKSYCKEVFNTEDLDFKLNKNDIDITYCNKDFDMLSGGEKKRVDLILQLSLRDLMCQYLGFSSNILALDEVADELDEKSAEAVMNLLAKCLKDVESVFIISHHDDLQLPTDNEIVVEKDENDVSTLKI